MNVDLSDTRASAILSALTDARHRSGTAALGMVLTLVIDVDESEHHDALRAATAAAREHPCRIVTVIRRAKSSPARLDAEIRIGDDNSLAEIIVLRLYGELRNQADSVVLPLLLPDAPVLVWWPGEAPPMPSTDPLGMLGRRRVTDAAASRRPAATLRTRSADHEPGDTDFAWTRLTPWRTLLAAALDQPYDPIVSGEVGAEKGNPSAELLATWLELQLGVPITRRTTRGPGITGVQLTTKRGEITLTRPDGRLATLVRTGQPNRAVALPRRSTPELLAEELRRLDPDEIYTETVRHVFGAEGHPAASAEPARRGGSLASASARADVAPRPSTTAKAMESKPPMPRSKKAPASVTEGGRPRRTTKAAAKAGATASGKKAAKAPATAARRNRSGR
jgi:glucose-6-phosphate dehydrogenase assembly protein OpcA